MGRGIRVGSFVGSGDDEIDDGRDEPSDESIEEERCDGADR